MIQDVRRGTKGRRQQELMDQGNSMDESCWQRRFILLPGQARSRTTEIQDKRDPALPRGDAFRRSPTRGTPFSAASSYRCGILFRQPIEGPPMISWHTKIEITCPHELRPQPKTESRIFVCETLKAQSIKSESTTSRREFHRRTVSVEPHNSAALTQNSGTSARRPATTIAEARIRKCPDDRCSPHCEFLQHYHRAQPAGIR
jgi:hypothetical protein